MNTALKVLGIVGCIALFVVTVALLAVYWAWAVSILWAWFLVPLGVQSIGVAHAYGLSCLIGLFLGTRGLNVGQEKDKNAWKHQLVFFAAAPLIALGFGYIALGFM